MLRLRHSSNFIALFDDLKWLQTRQIICVCLAEHDKGKIARKSQMSLRSHRNSFFYRSLLKISVAGCALISTFPAMAQDTEYNEAANVAASIVVTAQRTDNRVLPPQVGFNAEQLLENQPFNLGESLRGLSGVSIRVNSRGETIARVRGAEERQTAVFLDGAPFNVPWDGRIDLGVLPAGLIGTITVVKGASPVEYGANAVSGVVDLQTRRGKPYGGGGSGFTGTAETGTLGFTNIAGVVTAGKDDFDVTLSGGYIKRDSVPVADRDALPFSQGSGNRRTNTDLESFSIFGAVGNRFGPIETRLSVLYNLSERGIAPESDRNPAQFAPRYWRYPFIELTQVTFNAKAELGKKTNLILVAYDQKFNQQIDQFRDVTYTALRTRQLDDDDTIGGRATLSSRFGPVDLRLSGSYQTSEHEQIDTPFPQNIAGPKLKFRQNLSSVGAEADIRGGKNTLFTIGGGYDRSTTPLTGDKPAQPSADAGTFTASVQQTLTDNLKLTVTGGRRTRFAVARELFAEALGRFQPNPDLRPERSTQVDYIDGKNTIVQRVLANGRRQRFNLSGTESYGLDADIRAKIIGGLGFSLAANVQSSKADKGSAAIRRLAQRPRYDVTAILDYHLMDDRAYIAGEVQSIGQARDLFADGSNVFLPKSTEFNLRGRITLFRPKNGPHISLTAAGDNLTNEVVTAQAGLPSPGRTIRFGIRFD
jgi:iron complex outermembrane recepter protein